MPRQPTRPAGAFTRAEIARRYRRRKTATDETLRRLADGMVPEPMPNWLKAAAQQRSINNGDVQVAQPQPVDRPVFQPTEEFGRFVERQDNRDLAIAVLRVMRGAAQDGITSRDIAAQCQAEPLAVLKVLHFLHDEGLLSESDGSWHAVPNALAEWQYRLDHA